MSTKTSSAHTHNGARVVLSSGRAELLPPGEALDGAVPVCFSVLSPGTERRHMAETATGPARKAGYMSLGRATDGGWVLAPVPHGAAFSPDHPGLLTCAPGTPVEVAALARFQQMAILGLDRLPAGVELDGAVVLGSGPVALGCVLELHRRGARELRVRTSRPRPSIGRAPAAHIEAEDGNTHLVIDAAGVPERAVSMLVPGGILGLLGTPGPASTIPALRAHREGWTVIGMHELAGHSLRRYREAYTTATTWLASEMDPGLVASWCRTVPGRQAADVFTSLAASERRPPEPVIIFDWGSND